MTDPINPNTLLPMSLEVDKLQKIKQVHNSNHQNILSQIKIKEKEKKKKSVTKNEKTENLKVNDEDNSGKDKNKNDKDDNNKGTVIDVRV